MDSKLFLPIWVVGSLTLSALVTGWLYRGDGWRAEALEQTSVGGLIFELGALFFTIGLPFLALLTGTLSLDLMGMGRLWSSGDHLAGFTLGEWLRGAGEAFGATGFALFALWHSRGGSGLITRHEGAASDALAAVRDEVHWMFYRAPGTLISGDPFVGVLTGIGLTLFEWLLNPRFLSHDIKRENRWHLLLRLTCLIVSATLYLGTRNLWLMMAAHIAIQVVAARLPKARQTTLATDA